MKFNISIFLLAAMAGGSLMSCQKNINTVYVPPDSTYTGRIQFVLQYNPAQDSLFYGFLKAAGLADTLSSPGPFTVFVPTNAALYNVYPKDLTHYLLSGKYFLSDIPPGQTKILTSSNGYKIFVTSYVNGQDTNYTANGSLVQASDQRAANGVVQVLSRDMWQIYYPNCMKYIDGNFDLSIFAYALKRSHVDSLLYDSTQAYTVLAPNNNACASAGISLGTLAMADPDSLAEHFVKYHILPGRLFLYDFLRQFQPGMGDPQTILAPTLNGENIQVIIPSGGLSNPLSNPVEFSGLNSSNPATIQFYNPFDVPAGVGVVDELDVVLTP